jgi:hypothetical protein
VSAAAVKSQASMESPTRRRWSWAALAWAIAIELAGLPTFGLTVFLAPVGAALSTIAYRRAPHDAVLWIGTTLNALAVLGFIAILIGLVTGDVGIGFE